MRINYEKLFRIVGQGPKIFFNKFLTKMRELDFSESSVLQKIRITLGETYFLGTGRLSSFSIPFHF